MAMLAEKKSKQKWSQDPRNKAWSTDTGRFGYQMLTKMGWSDGKGLGATENGSTTHVKISHKNDNLGVGAKIDNDDNWLSHQDDFNDLLAHLNGVNNDSTTQEGQPKKKDMETIARSSKKRVFYGRFIKSKNTSSYSATDMACIMGKRSKSAPDSPADQSEDEDSDDSCASCPAISNPDPSTLKTINSTQSVQEYFAMKMAELKQRREQEPAGGLSQESDTANNRANLSSEIPDENCSSKEKKKKRKKDKKRKLEEPGDCVEKKRKNKSNYDADIKLAFSKNVEETLQENESSQKKKKKKQEKKVDVLEAGNQTQSMNEDSITRKKPNPTNDLGDTMMNETDLDRTERKKRKKEQMQDEEKGESVQKTKDDKKKSKKKKRKKKD